MGVIEWTNVFLSTKQRLTTCCVYCVGNSIPRDMTRVGICLGCLMCTIFKSYRGRILLPTELRINKGAHIFNCIPPSSSPRHGKAVSGYPVGTMVEHSGTAAIRSFRSSTP